MELLLNAARGARAMQVHADHLRRTQSWADDYAAPSSAAGLAKLISAGLTLVPVCFQPSLLLMGRYQCPQDRKQQSLVTSMHSRRVGRS